MKMPIVLALAVLLSACASDAEWAAWGARACAANGGWTGETRNVGAIRGHSVMAVCGDGTLRS
ncbi:MAG: hypothetical protein A3E78_12195 [Alphaproteobacteria bacterium RIFCSPHIGHO2_12_FULL_63_12]|nr:MAG: hypothetical protein A3E78_12195 [Alphaproteobacteria bacterium RIFCSPHIGHO2_12_FULL_63_12]